MPHSDDDSCFYFMMMFSNYVFLQARFPKYLAALEVAIFAVVEVTERRR